MKKSLAIKRAEVVVLCGGRGTRIQGVLKDIPKILAPFQHKTFLDILVARLEEAGFASVTLSVGYLREKIRTYVQDKLKTTLKVNFVEETEPLGTAGALRNCLPQINADLVMVLNGDCITPVDFNDFFKFHTKMESDLSFVLCKQSNSGDFGNVSVGADGRLKAFNEKTTHSSGLINAGIYLFNKDILKHLPPKTPSSLETEFFPAIIRNKKCFGFVTEAQVMDIGTPERYTQSQEVFKKYL